MSKNQNILTEEQKHLNDIGLSKILDTIINTGNKYLGEKMSEETLFQLKCDINSCLAEQFSKGTIVMTNEICGCDVGKEEYLGTINLCKMFKNFPKDEQKRLFFTYTGYSEDSISEFMFNKEGYIESVVFNV